MRNGGHSEERIAAEIARRWPNLDSGPFEVWPENIEIVAVFMRACGYWTWLSTGMSVIRLSLDWWRLRNVTLIEVPRLLAFPKWKRKRRERYLIQGLEMMEQGALAVFSQQEKQRQQEAKRKRDMETAKRRAKVR